MIDGLTCCVEDQKLPSSPQRGNSYGGAQHLDHPEWTEPVCPRGANVSTTPGDGGIP